MRAVEMSYLRGACGVSRLDGLNNESVYGRCGMRGCGSGVECGVVEWLKRSTLRWFDILKGWEMRNLLRRCI